MGRDRVSKQRPPMVSPYATALRPLASDSQAVEWMRESLLCSRLLDDPSFTPIETLSRQPNDSTEDSLIAETLNSKATIRLWASFYRAVREGERQNADTPLGELLCVLVCGTGMNGHAGLAHGGFISFVLDEVLTMLAGIHRTPGSDRYTVSLNVDLKKPIPTPCTILARAELESRSHGRKYWLRGSIEDGNGTVYATATCLVLDVKGKL